MAQDQKELNNSLEVKGNMQTRSFDTHSDIVNASALDRSPSQFGDEGITVDQLQDFLVNPSNGGIVLADETLHGFATFEILQPGLKPQGYPDSPATSTVTAMIQELTTDEGYVANTPQKHDFQILCALEEESKRRGCMEVWIALAVPSRHKFSKENMPGHDVYKFYTTHGYTTQTSETNPLIWDPNGYAIPCLLYRKVLS